LPAIFCILVTMRLFLLLAVLPVSLTIYAQDYTFPADILSAKTSLHKNVRGTRLYIIPPQGYQIIPYQSCVMDDKGDILAVKEWNEYDYYSNKKIYSKEKLSETADKIFYYRELRINGFPATMAVFRSRKDTSLITFRLVFGDKDFIVSVVENMQPGDKTSLRKVKELFRSIYYDKTKRVDPFTLEIFTMDTAVSSFRMTDRVSRTVLFGEKWTFFYNLKVPPKDTVPEAPFVKVNSTSLILYDKDADSASLVVSDIMAEQKKKGFERWSDEHEWRGKVNGLTVYHVEIYGSYKSDGSIIPKIETSNDDKGKTLIYLHIVFLGDRSVVILKGMAFEGYSKWIAEFKELASTIRKK
jgi:hypothetical protein